MSGRERNKCKVGGAPPRRRPWDSYLGWSSGPGGWGPGGRWGPDIDAIALPLVKFFKHSLPLVKFFKHSGPLPNPTRTDNHDNSDNVAQRSRPSSVHTHHQSDRPTAQDSQRRGPRSPISIAAGDTPSAKLPGISAAPPLYAARGAAKA